MDRATKVKVGEAIRGMMITLGINGTLEVVRYDRPGLFDVVAREIAKKLFYDDEVEETVADRRDYAIGEIARWFNTDRRRSELWRVVLIRMDELQAVHDLRRRW